MARDNYQTATGERSTYTLADGSSLMLNTGSSVDIVFDDKQRLLRLRAGEVLVQTAKDSAANPRPSLCKPDKAAYVRWVHVSSCASGKTRLMSRYRNMQSKSARSASRILSS